MSSVTERFAAEHFTLNSISEGRRAQVLTALARLEEFLGKPAEAATDDDLRAWLVALIGTDHLQPSTASYYLRSVTPFYHWCWRARLLDADSLMRIRDVKPPRGASRGVPRPYSRKEIARLKLELSAKFPRLHDPSSAELRSGVHLLSRWRKGTSPYRSVRKHVMRVMLETIIELALLCGLRQNEIYNLSLDDVHPDNEYIVVRYAKRVDQNPKEREVPYPDSTRALMRQWFRLRTDMGATTDCLWLSATGPNPTIALPRPRMQRILHSFGDWQLHRLRHTCATGRLREGMEIELLQRFLGHSDITMTLRYAQLVRSDVHKAARRTDAAFQQSIGWAA